MTNTITLDANKELLTFLVSRNTLQILERDDAYPEVGMGLSVDMAIDMAEKSLKEERPGLIDIIAELGGPTFEEIRDQVYNTVYNERYT